MASFAADAAAINPNDIKKRLVNGVTTFSINGKATFITGARKL